MKFLLSIILLFFISEASYGQKLAAKDIRLLLWAEDTLQLLSRRMIQDADPEFRLKADSQFTRLLVKSLRRPYSFYFPFDSVVSVSKLTPADSSFRIFTWQIQVSQNNFRQKGAIQMNTSDGSLKLFPLNDVSEFSESPQKGMKTPSQWIGAIYYHLISEFQNGVPCYTLLGYDDYSKSVTRKWIEVLRFDSLGTPLFGGDFKYRPEPIKAPLPASRFLLEFQKDGRCRLNYDSSLKMIVFEHLVSPDGKPDMHENLLPDGDYEGFRWQNGVWVHSPELPLIKTNIKVTDIYSGNAPLEAGVRTSDGTLNDEMLLRKSEESIEKYEALEKAEKARKEAGARERIRLKGKPPAAPEYQL